MPQTYKVKLSDGREFNVTTDGAAPSEDDVLASLKQTSPDNVSSDKTTQSPDEQPSLLRQVYDKMTSPLAQLTPDMTKAIDSAMENHPIIGGIGKTITNGILGLSSPLNIGLGAATAGESLAGEAIPSLARVAQLGRRILGVPVAAHGAVDVASGDPSRMLSGALELAGGVHGMKPGTSELPVTESSKPKFRLDNESGTLIPIDNTGKQIGSAVAPGKELDPELASQSVFSKPNQFTGMDAVNLPRAIRASVDMSAPLRQGLPLIHRKEWWSSLDDMVKAFGSDKAYKAINDSIYESPLFQPSADGTKSFAEKAGLFISDHVNSREEAYATKIAGSIPLVKNSERAYTTFLNKLRADTFESLVNSAKDAGLNPEQNDELSRAIAGYVNTSTGRGSLGSLEQYSKALNATLFSPRLMASRVQMLNPAYYINQPSFVRKEALKSLMAVAGAGTLVSGLGKLAGADVEPDPASSDFGKVKIGDTRLDPFAGFQQYAVLANRLAPMIDGLPTGRFKSSTSSKEYDMSNPPFGGQTRFEVAKNFGANKLNPVMRLAYDWLSQSKKSPFSIPQETANLFVPMFAQDVYEMAHSKNPAVTAIGAPASFFGMGSQVYGR